MKIPLLLMALFSFVTSTAQRDYHIEVNSELQAYAGPSVTTKKLATIPVATKVRITGYVKCKGVNWWEVQYDQKTVFLIDNPKNLNYSQEEKIDFIRTDSLRFLRLVQGCKSIYCKEDKFEGGYECSSNLSQTLSLTKYTKRGKTTYSLYASVNGSTPAFGQGLIILLQNGSRITRPGLKNDISTDADGYSATAFTYISTAELRLLQQTPVTAVKVYIYDTDVDSGEAENLRVEAAYIAYAKP